MGGYFDADLRCYLGEGPRPTGIVLSKDRLRDPPFGRNQWLRGFGESHRSPAALSPSATARARTAPWRA